MVFIEGKGLIGGFKDWKRQEIRENAIAARQWLQSHHGDLYTADGFEGLAIGELVDLGEAMLKCTNYRGIYRLLAQSPRRGNRVLLRSSYRPPAYKGFTSLDRCFDTI